MPLTYEEIPARIQLKQLLAQEQKYQCALTGIRTDALDMHEWLVKRSDYPIKRLQAKIFHRYNCILITRQQHDRIDRKTRDWECSQWAIGRYGYDKINDWLISLNLKTFGTFEQWLYRHQPENIQ